ncbi:glycosyltransferase family 4 protein [Anaeromyxobacter sp. Fw109-5]|uniref:glycosyltransferase family 4 protein n=1 Tax=Anaeromyxobacter sp. (strain Fw109-5) TaxID=404589 RepID=UPI00130520F0|nr:glycosyltransferase family 4 protein [Anaeromyxobacter sp. Fw109-5]
MPVYQEVHRLLGDDFKIAFLASSEANRSWDVARADVACCILPGKHLFLARRDWALHVNVGMAKAIRNHRATVVAVAGYDNPSYWLALAAAKLMRLPVVLWSGSHGLSGRTQRGPVRWLKERFVRAADAYLSYGSMAAEYLVELGALRGRIVVGSNAVESSVFANGTARDTARNEHRIGDEQIVLFSGQLIERKGLEVLIRALGRASSSAHLWVVGNGPDREKYERLASEVLPGRTRFFGHRKYAELPGIYAAADVFVMPSLVEVWGLVLNEAMASGLPVIASRQAGATADLVIGKDTGLAFDANSVDDLAAQLRKMLGDPALRARYGANGRELVSRLDTRRYAADFLKAAELALAARAR